jgi:hypothetical protein
VDNCEHIDSSTTAANYIEEAVRALGLNAYAAVHGGDNICYPIELYNDSSPSGDQPYFEEDIYEVDDVEYSVTYSLEGKEQIANDAPRKLVPSIGSD